MTRRAATRRTPPAAVVASPIAPATALRPDVLYLGDNGRATCGARRCAGATAYATGRDLSGQRLLALSTADALAHGIECETCGLRPAAPIPASTTWTCHARPARLGRTCGAVNATGGTLYGRDQIEVCASCGCTKKASDDRTLAT